MCITCRQTPNYFCWMSRYVFYPLLAENLYKLYFWSLFTGGTTAQGNEEYYSLCLEQTAPRRVDHNIRVMCHYYTKNHWFM